jgi:hypothetical protein
MPHDIVARTGVIFKWNARMARLREHNIVDEGDDVSSQNSMDVQQGSDVDTVSAGGISDQGSTDMSDDSNNNDATVSANASKKSRK